MPASTDHCHERLGQRDLLPLRGAAQRAQFSGRPVESNCAIREHYDSIHPIGELSHLMRRDDNASRATEVSEYAAEVR